MIAEHAKPTKTGNNFIFDFIAFYEVDATFISGSLPANSHVF